MWPILLNALSMPIYYFSRVITQVKNHNRRISVWTEMGPLFNPTHFSAEGATSLSCYCLHFEGSLLLLSCLSTRWHFPKRIVCFFFFFLAVYLVRPPLWSSGLSFWLQIQRSRVRSPALPDFLSSGGSGMGSTQPREVKLRSYLNKKVAAPG